MCFSAHPGCAPVSGCGCGFSGGRLRASSSLPICPSITSLSLSLLPWQAKCPQWWMSLCIVSVSESCSSATCHVGPCQRLSVRSALMFPSFCLLLFRPLLHVHPAAISLLSGSHLGPVLKKKKVKFPEIHCQFENFPRFAKCLSQYFNSNSSPLRHSECQEGKCKTC